MKQQTIVTYTFLVTVCLVSVNAKSGIQTQSISNANKCDGSCGQGEGDCDWNSDCLPGLICEGDWWWGTDYCEAGPDTKNFEWGPWGEFGECEGNCGEMGKRIRHRLCIPPSNGGYPCPAQLDSELEACEMAPCPVFEDCKTYDVGFMLDESGSVSFNDWLKVGTFTKEIAKTAKIHANGGRTSVVTFEHDALLQIKFNTHTNYDSFASAVDRLNQRRGGTNIIGALNMGLDSMFQTYNGMRQGSEKIAILITDGQDYPITNSINSYRVVAEKHRQRKIKLLVVGVGFVDNNKLKELVDDPKDFFVANDFDELLKTFVKGVAESVQKPCKDNTSLTTPAPTTVALTTANPLTSAPTTAAATIAVRTTTTSTSSASTTATPTTVAWSTNLIGGILRGRWVSSANPPTSENGSSRNSAPSTAFPTTADNSTVFPITPSSTVAAQSTVTPTAAVPTKDLITTASSSSPPPTTTSPTTDSHTTDTTTNDASTTAAPSNDGPTTIEPATAFPRTAAPSTSAPTTSFPTAEPLIAKCRSNSIRENCVSIGSECWCYHEASSANDVCGYLTDYAGKYYSLANSSHSPSEIIRKVGKIPHPCLKNNQCKRDCATNMCDVYDRCYGTSLRCWTDRERWASSFAGIVRCINMEDQQSESSDIN